MKDDQKAGAKSTQIQISTCIGNGVFNQNNHIPQQTLNKKYQIFISSTYEDLKDERDEVIKTILQLEHIPIGMEMFNAGDDEQWDVIKRTIDASDYYVVILGLKYGSMTKEGIGYTEKEYDYAKEQRIPIITLIKDENIATTPEQRDEDMAKVREFRQKVKENKMIKIWRDKHELGKYLSTSLQSEFKLTPRAGWISCQKDLLLKELKQEKEHRNIIDEWGLSYIFRSRAEKNTDSDLKFKTEKIKQLDGIAFGLSGFRTNHTQDIKKCLREGMEIRLLVMNPNGAFIQQREKEENEPAGKMSKSIRDLVDWGKKLKKETNGDISIKFYNSMTLDFYWRMDNVLYIGPYLYGKDSQQTITLKFEKSDKEDQDCLGFRTYTEYFEDLWNDNSLTVSVL